MDDYWPPGEGIVGSEMEEREGGAEWEYDSDGNYIGDKKRKQEEDEEEDQDIPCAPDEPPKVEQNGVKQKTPAVVPHWNPINRESTTPTQGTQTAVEELARGMLTPVSEADEAARRVAVRPRAQDYVDDNPEVSLSSLIPGVSIINAVQS